MSLLSSDYKDRETGPVGADQQELIMPDKDYITISITSARIDKDRRLFSKYHGAVYSFFTFSHDQSGKAEMASITSPRKLAELDGDGVNNIIQMKDIVLGPVPYRGGAIEVEIGLLAVKYDDIAEKFIGFISKVGEQTGAPAFFAKSIPILGLIKSGIETITKTDKVKSLKIGISQDMWGDNLKTGSYFASDARNGTIDSSKLAIDPDDGRLLLDGKPFTDASYFVYNISSSKERVNAKEIPELLTGYKKIQDAIREHDLEKAAKAVKAYKFLCLASPDLIEGDRIRVWKNGKRAYDLAAEKIEEQVILMNEIGSKGTIEVRTLMPDFAEIAVA